MAEEDSSVACNGNDRIKRDVKDINIIFIFVLLLHKIIYTN
jgi:hypothetical protein